MFERQLQEDSSPERREKRKGNKDGATLRKVLEDAIVDKLYFSKNRGDWVQSTRRDQE